MKKVYVIIAIAAISLCAASCGNKKAENKVAEPAAVEQKADDSIKAAAKEAAEDVAKTAIDKAASEAKEAIKGN